MLHLCFLDIGTIIHLKTVALCVHSQVDPDAPSPDAPKYRFFLHWLVTNIPSVDVKRGNVIEDYMGPASLPLLEPNSCKTCYMRTAPASQLPSPLPLTSLSCLFCLQAGTPGHVTLLISRKSLDCGSRCQR